jgi:succinate dehydrogenase / fumarate reductase membrane anchor subunit
MAGRSMETPLRRVLYFGAAHDGTSHFWRQRLTALANIPLTIGFVVIVIAAVGRPLAEVAALIGSPVAAAVLILMILSVCIHMRIGMQVIIEDYIHGPLLKTAVIVANTFFAAAVGVLAALAVLKLAFGA